VKRKIRGSREGKSQKGGWDKTPFSISYRLGNTTGKLSLLSLRPVKGETQKGEKRGGGGGVTEKLAFPSLEYSLSAAASVVVRDGVTRSKKG